MPQRIAFYTRQVWGEEKKNRKLQAEKMCQLGEDDYSDWVLAVQRKRSLAPMTLRLCRARGRDGDGEVKLSM